MRLVALALVFGALPCKAFRPKARPAWEGVAIVKPVTSAEPSNYHVFRAGQRFIAGGKSIPGEAALAIACSTRGISVRADTAEVSRAASGPLFCRPMGFDTVVDHILSFAKALLAAFDASGEAYKPVGTGEYECGKLARYLKDVLEGALAVPAFAGNDKEVFEFLQGLSATDKNTLWRTARWYNHLVELTLPEDEEEG